MNLEIENVFKGMLLTLIVLLVAVEIGNPQRWSQQLRQVPASARISTIRPAKFRTRQVKTPTQGVYGVSRRRG